jgi:NAD(P)-dependent dehydrogenase (short-subunit alcohol dehydrogenase family)
VTRSLEGRVALVTGATQAMGAAIAHRLAADGAAVVGVGRSVDRGNEVARGLRAAGYEADFVAADISVEAEVERAVAAAVSRYGRLDVVVNNAAAMDASAAEGPAHLQRSEVFDAVLKVGLYAPFWFAKHACPVMIDAGQGGSFVGISSYAGSRGVAGIPAYTASKGGLEALTRQLAVDYAEHGIRANTLVLGSIAVPRNAGLHADTEMADALRAARLTARAGCPEDVAAAVSFLVSDEAAFITGTTLDVDGGLLAKAPVVAVARRASAAAARQH